MLTVTPRMRTVPILCDTDGMPIQRNFVHVEDLVSAVLAAIDHPKARQQTFNICMDEPVNYARVAEHLRQNRAACPRSRSAPHATRTGWITPKAKFLLGWRPTYDLPRLIDEAWDYRRSPEEPRKVWYPG